MVDIALNCDMPLPFIDHQETDDGETLIEIPHTEEIAVKKQPCFYTVTKLDMEGNVDTGVLNSLESPTDQYAVSIFGSKLSGYADESDIWNF